MGQSCAIIPQVKNTITGEIIDSKLFSDLLSYVSTRDKAVDIYLRTKNEEFIQNTKDLFELDENGEPTLKSLIQNTDISEFIENNVILKNLNKKIGYYQKNSEDVKVIEHTVENINNLSEKADAFNRESLYKDDYVAIVTTENTSNGIEGLAVQVVPKTEESTHQAEIISYNLNLNKKLREILENNGVTTGSLTSLEERLGVNGVTDFDTARVAANGLAEMIRLADGVRGEQALPEEFAHWVLEALGSNNVFARRLIDTISKNNLDAEILAKDYNKYYEQYAGNAVLLAKEAAGKLLAKHFLDNEKIPIKPYRNLLQRLIDSIKKFLRTFNASDIQKAMIQAHGQAGSLAQNILLGRMDSQISKDNIVSKDKLYNLSNRAERIQETIQKVISNEMKRYQIYSKRNPEAPFNQKQADLISELTRHLEQHNEIEGIMSFVQQATSIMVTLRAKIQSLLSSSSVDMQKKASLLRDIRNYIYSYSDVTESILEVIIDEERYADNRFENTAKTTVNELQNLISELRKNYKDLAMPMFIDFLKPFLGDSLVVPFGKYKGKQIKAEEIVQIADKDITFFDRWLDSMADSNSYLVKLIDQAIKDKKEDARLEVIEIEKNIKAAAMELEQAGYKDTKWMFERDSIGKLTGRYISEYNRGDIKNFKAKFYRELREKYGENPEGDRLISYKREEAIFYNTYFPNNIPDSRFRNKAFENLSPAQKKFYNTIIELKKTLDEYLPDRYTKTYNTIKIRKDLMERAINSGSPVGAVKAWWENLKDSYIRRSDDIELGDKVRLIDFEGNQVQMLPIYYTKLREGEKEEDISQDVVSTIISYAAMATDYKHMNEIIDILETGRSVLRDNFKTVATEGDRTLKETISAFGKKIEKKVLKSKNTSRILDRIDDAFEMQVYGRYMRDEGTWGKVDLAKLANNVNKMTALNTYALNLISGISNVTTGSIMMRIESFCGQFFNEKDTIKADYIYSKSIPAFLAEIGNRVKVSKLALWNEMFNVRQDYEKHVHDVEWDKKNWAKRAMSSQALYFMNNAGEHWMSTRTSLAVANTIKFKDKLGKIVSLWDAMDVEFLDKSNHKKGARLVVKEGYTKLDGTAWTQQDTKNFTRKVMAINERLHGIYNNADKNAFQRLAVGRMAIMYRKWMRPAFNRRYKSLSYNFDLQTWTEGYYRTTGRFLAQLAKELKEGKFAIAANWENLTDYEKQNIKRALTEVGHFLLLSAALGLIYGIKDDDDDKKKKKKEERNYISYQIELQLRRLYTELGIMVPWIPSITSEGLKILKSPAAGINTMEQLSETIDLLDPTNYLESSRLRSGRFKGDLRATKLFFESPIVPMNKTIYRAIHPEESIPFYKQ